MVAKLLYIRSRQLARELSDLGLLYNLLLLGVTAILIYGSFKLYQKEPHAYYLTGTLIFLCALIQVSRKDKQFLHLHIENERLEVFLEYAVITFPFSITSIPTQNWYCYPILLIAIYITSRLKFNFIQRTYLKNISVIIPASMFEWISGFRRSLFPLIPLYLLALSFSWFRILPLFILWLITVTICSFYNECESLQILKEGDKRAMDFLLHKLKAHSSYLIALYLPVLIINTIFNTEDWDINLLFILIQVSLLSFAICLKYSNYKPNRVSFGNNLILSFVSIGSLIPYLLPIPLIMACEYFKKAERNLEPYLND